MIVPRYYENLSVLHENTMPARAYYIPASKRMDNLVEHREESDRMQLLNGTWKFQYFNSIYDIQDSFFEKNYDTENFDEIQVPSVWQMAGYDTHQYTNIRYPFPFDPPYVPQDIPCGAYVHTFEYSRDEKAPKSFLNFEGVDSCFYVWINGSYIGYSQVSHMTSEFDVTDVLQDGTNTVAVLVMKWCDGSYLEDQDKFRMSGIFRDVYILKRPKQAISDYHIKTRIEDMLAKVEIEMKFYFPLNVKISIEDRNGAVVALGSIAEEGKAVLEIASPELWNTENPYLYKLILETENEVIVDHIALRKIEIKDQVIYLNGQKIKFRGVNRHDSDPVTGFTINTEQITTDLTLMKQHNFNAIRSSHYPNAPFFYEMCDKYGFMIIDEADIEAHGPFMIYRKEDTDYNRFKRWNEKIADDPVWEEAIVDRVKLMVERDKNRFCIVMWSMGNESAYGCNFEKALEWTKNFDPDRITQYESARYRNYDETYDYSNLDVYSRMYPALSEIQEYLDKDGSKPFLLVEYCHSMGNGPGDFEDYFQMIQDNDKMCGYVSGKEKMKVAVRYCATGGVWHPQVDYAAYTYAAGGTWTDTPEKVINYVSCHDNLTLWDKLQISRPDCDAGERLAMNRLAAAMVFTAQGVPFFLGGEEFARTKPAGKNGEISENSYNLPYETNVLRYDWSDGQKGLQQYYRGLIAFRKAHKGLRMTDAEEIRQNILFMEMTSEQTIAFTIRQPEETLLVAYNASGRKETLLLPDDRTWTLYIDDLHAGTRPIGSVHSNMELPATGCVVLGINELSC